MNLTSCNTCGIVVDKNKIKQKNVVWSDEGDCLMPGAIWDGEKYIATFPCPVCKEKIPFGL